MLPTAFKSGSLSWRELVYRGPYPANRDQLTEDELAAFLKRNLDLIEVWLAWSGDKRSTTGSFLRKSGSQYELGYVERGGKVRPSEFFDEPSRPCARFILDELAV